MLGVLGEPATLPVSRMHEKRGYPSLMHMPAAAPMSGLWQGCGDLGHVGSIINGNHSIKDASIHSGLNPTWCLLSWQKEPNGKLGGCVGSRERV